MDLNRIKIEDCQVVCVLTNGNIISYKNSCFYIFDCNTFVCIQCYYVKLGFNEKILSHIYLLKRFFRLGIRAAVELNNNIIFFISNIVYELNLISGVLSKGYSLYKGRKALNIVVIEDVDDFEDTCVFGEYFNNPTTQRVSIYYRKSVDDWDIIYTFEKEKINHIHNIIPDKYNSCVWVLTGDSDNASGIWKFTNNFKCVDKILAGRQSYRSCVAFALKSGLLYATDTPLENNYIMLLMKNENNNYSVKRILPISGSCIYGCKVNDKYVFSTSVEGNIKSKNILKMLFNRKRGKGIMDDYSHLYIGNLDVGFLDIYKVRKDFLPFVLFQFSSLRFPSGNNMSNNIYVYHTATISNDMKTKLIKFED